MRALQRLYEGALAGLGLLAGLAFLALALLISIDVIGRNAGALNLPWLIEVAEYTLYVATFAAAPWVLHRNAHVRVDIVATALPPGPRWVAALVCELIGLGVSATLCAFGWRAARQAYDAGALVIKQLIFPEWWLLAVIPVAALLLFVEFGLRLGRLLSGRAAPAADREVAEL